MSTISLALRFMYLLASRYVWQLITIEKAIKIVVNGANEATMDSISHRSVVIKVLIVHTAVLG